MQLKFEKKAHSQELVLRIGSSICRYNDCRRYEPRIGRANLFAVVSSDLFRNIVVEEAASGEDTAAKGTKQKTETPRTIILKGSFPKKAYAWIQIFVESTLC